MNVMTASAGNTGSGTAALVSSAGQPEGRSQPERARTTPQPLERRKSQPFHWRSEAHAENRIDDEIGIERVVVPHQVSR